MGLILDSDTTTTIWRAIILWSLIDNATKNLTVFPDIGSSIDDM